jgi:hypothetical protein
VFKQQAYGKRHFPARFDIGRRPSRRQRVATGGEEVGAAIEFLRSPIAERRRPDFG